MSPRSPCGPIAEAPAGRFCGWPVAWLAYTLIRGGLSSPSFAGPDNTTSDYPYDFLDVDKYGGGQVAALYVRFSNRSVRETA